MFKLSRYEFDHPSNIHSLRQDTHRLILASVKEHKSTERVLYDELYIFMACSSKCYVLLIGLGHVRDLMFSRLAGETKCFKIVYSDNCNNYCLLHDTEVHLDTHQHEHAR